MAIVLYRNFPEGVSLLIDQQWYRVLQRKFIRHYRIAGWASRDHVNKCRQNKQNTNGRLSRFTASESKATNNNQQNEHDRHAAHVYGRSSESWEQEPADYSADDVACGKSDVEIESLKLGEAGGFEEDY